VCDRPRDSRKPVEKALDDRTIWWVTYVLVIGPLVVLLALSYRGLSLALAQERARLGQERLSRLTAIAERLTPS